MKLLHHVEAPMLKEPGSQARALIEQRRSCRHFALTDLRPMPGLCAWCGFEPCGKFESRFRRYCGKDCSETAWFYAKPQAPGPKAWILLFRQDGACAGCGLSFESEIDALIKRRMEIYSPTGEAREQDRVTLWQVGHDTGPTWEVDHVVPLHLGGNGVDLGNVQVLCIPCHRKKSACEATARGGKGRSR